MFVVSQYEQPLSVQGNLESLDLSRAHGKPSQEGEASVPSLSGGSVCMCVRPCIINFNVYKPISFFGVFFFE